jgi:hypothetical protein
MNTLTNNTEMDTAQLPTTAQFVSRLAADYQAWMNDDIDWATMTERQRVTWETVGAMGDEVVDEVMRGLSAQTPPRDYSARIERTDAGSPSLKISATSLAGHRQIAAFVCELAAIMERVTPVVGAHWSIVADPNNGRVVLQLAGDHETELAYNLLSEMILQNELA